MSPETALAMMQAYRETFDAVAARQNAALVEYQEQAALARDGVVSAIEKRDAALYRAAGHMRTIEQISGAVRDLLLALPAVGSA